jgi:hypothetical protein
MQPFAAKPTFAGIDSADALQFDGENYTFSFLRRSTDDQIGQRPNIFGCFHFADAKTHIEFLLYGH